MIGRESYSRHHIFTYANIRLSVLLFFLSLSNPTLCLQRQLSRWWIIIININVRSINALLYGATLVPAASFAVSRVNRCDYNRLLSEFRDKGWSLFLTLSAVVYFFIATSRSIDAKKDNEYHDRLLLLQGIVLPATSPSAVLSAVSSADKM